MTSIRSTFMRFLADFFDRSEYRKKRSHEKGSRLQTRKMSDEPRSITVLCDLMEKLKTQIKVVENELAYKDNQNKDDFRAKLTAKSEKMELVKTSLDALFLKTNSLPIREHTGRSTACEQNDSGYNSSCSGRRDGVYLQEADITQTVGDSVATPRAGLGGHCSACLQQIQIPMQVTQENPGTENEDDSKFQSSDNHKAQ